MKVAIAVAGMLMLAGCVTPRLSEGPSPGTRVRSNIAPNARVSMDTVQIIDRDLQRTDGRGRTTGKLAVEATDSERSGSGTLEVWATIRNRTDYPLQIEARVQFFDEAEAPMEGPSAWKRIHLPPNGTGIYRERSLGVERIAHYYVEVQEAQ